MHMHIHAHATFMRVQLNLKCEHIRMRMFIREASKDLFSHIEVKISKKISK